MTRTLTITYDKSNEDIAVMCVGESNLFYTTIIKMFMGEKAEQLYKELTGQDDISKGFEDFTRMMFKQGNMIVKVESEET